MAHHRLILPARVRWRLAPWWGRVLVVYALSRVLTTGIMLVVAVVQAGAEGTGVPDYLHLAADWDGRWYWLIAASGYPSELPLDAQGYVTENAWAFMPGYPFLAGALLRLGMPFPLAGVAISLLAGAAAALLLHRLLSESGLDEGGALFAVVLLCTAPLSPLFQVSYAEAMALALLLLALLLVHRRRFGLLLPVVVLLALTRPVGLAFALFLLLYLVLRTVRALRAPAEHPLPVREGAAIVVAGLTSFAAGIAWIAIAWAATGSPTAYTDTELAWRSGYLGHGGLVPFHDWFAGLAFWARFLGVPPGAAGALAVPAGLLMMAGSALLLLAPWARRLGPVIRLWLASYLVYLFAVFFPQSSIWRLLLPLAPGLGALAVPRSRALRAALVAAGIAGQVLWVHGYWWRVPGDWSPP